MSNAQEEVRLSMRVMINKHKNKVLFALVDNNFADILLSFLTLPLGVILRLLKKQYGDQAPVIGSINSLHNGIENLDSIHFCAETGKVMLLNPRNSLDAECSKLKIHIDDTQPIKYFTCAKFDCKFRQSSVIMYHAEGARCECGTKMNREIGMRNSDKKDEEEIFTVKTASFLVSDDLQLIPNVAGSVVESLKNLGVMDIDGAEQRTITVGIKEIMDLFKGSLFSKTPLTDLILPQKQLHPYSPITPKSEQFTLSSQISKRIIVKIMVQKSTNKLLFVQSDQDFVDFLFSFLIIPLGEVEFLLDSNSSLGSIDKLYKSLQNLNAEKYMKNQNTKDTLLKRKIAPKFLSKNHIFPLTEKYHPNLYYDKNKSGGIDYLSSKYIPQSDFMLKDPKGGKNYVKGPGMFMITDDLFVTPLCMFSSLWSLKGMDISLSDVKELEVEIGLEKGLSILKASLTSTAALTNGLGPFLKNELKKED